MNESRIIDTAKNYLQKKLGLSATEARMSYQHGDCTFNARVTLTAEGRQFEVYMSWKSDEIRLTEFHGEDKFQDYRIPVTGAERVRGPWAMRMRNGRIKYFDTHDEMMAYSSRPEVSWKSMGCTNAVLKR